MQGSTRQASLSVCSSVFAVNPERRVGMDADRVHLLLAQLTCPLLT